MDDSQLMMVLCGSSMSFMERQVLGYESPLYGRHTAQIKVEPFGYADVRKFLPRYSNEDAAIAYGLTDGIPQYLAHFKADEREMTKYIIGTISDMDTPMNPSAKGARSMTAYLQGLDFADIQKERDQVIGATDEDIRGLKDLIASVLEEKNLCVIGNEDNLKSQSDMFMQLKNLYE